MRTFIALSLTGLLAVFVPAQDLDKAAPQVVFRTADLYVVSPEHPLAAYQVEIAAPRSRVNFVGVEGGEHPAFHAPPFYDPKAMQQERLILAAYDVSSSEQLPRGKIRVATIHYQVPVGEEVQFKTRIQAAATVEGKPITVTATIEERKSE